MLIKDPLRSKQLHLIFFHNLKYIGTYTQTFLKPSAFFISLIHYLGKVFSHHHGKHYSSSTIITFNKSPVYRKNHTTHITKKKKKLAKAKFFDTTKASAASMASIERPCNTVPNSLRSPTKTSRHCLSDSSKRRLYGLRCPPRSRASRRGPPS